MTEGWNDYQTDNGDLAAQTEAAKVTAAMMVDISSVLFDKASAYTSLIVAGGYVGAFSIWAFVSPHLTKQTTVWVALLLGISLAVFVAYEVFKMVVGARALLPMASLVNPPKQPRELLKAFEEFDLKRKRESVSPAQVWVWIVALAVTVFTGLAAMLLLFYNFLAIILEWPLWPA